MYYDLRFPYRISAEAGVAQDEDGNDAEAYLLTTLKQCKAPMVTEEKYNEFHESQRQGLAKTLGIKAELITCISPQEYEANMGEEDEDD